MSTIIKKLSIETGLNEIDVYRIMHSAPDRYKIFHIMKRSGAKRKISQPAKEVKILQRALIEVLLRNLPIHACSTAYQRGLSIRDNAAAHAKAGPILKIDFKDFFPSIKKSDWTKYCKKHSLLRDDAEIELTGSLLFQNYKELPFHRLAIGAPSSPMLSNILMYDFDRFVSESLSATRITYTRYADDLTFSAPRTGYLLDVQKVVKSAMRAVEYPRLTINVEKTTYVTQKYRRSVTGLVLANDGRVTIGWKKKRELHASVHRALNNKLEKSELQSLAGMLAFVNSAEPAFLDVLIKKYGIQIVRSIQGAAVIRK